MDTERWAILLCLIGYPASAVFIAGVGWWFRRLIWGSEDLEPFWVTGRTVGLVGGAVIMFGLGLANIWANGWTW